MSLIGLDIIGIEAGHVSCSSLGQEDAMDVMVEVTTALTGLALGVAAGRLFLAGILAVTFGRRS
jgi:hypothetical protein